MNTGSYASVEKGFDLLAPLYEKLVESNPLHAYLRIRSLGWLDEAFQPATRVLEIGCGTGTEAVHLARRGVLVTATDVSEAMAEATRERVRREDLEDVVRVVRCAAGQLSTRFDPETFEGAYASFGPLNCEPDLPAALGEIASVLKPNAPLLTSVMSRPCAVELGVAGIRLRFRKAFRRLRDGTTVDLYGTGSVRFRIYSEADLRRAFAPLFKIERMEGWFVAVPPPYMVQMWNKTVPLHRPLEWLDERLRRRWPFRGWGDHIHVWARRRST